MKLGRPARTGVKHTERARRAKKTKEPNPPLDNTRRRPDLPITKTRMQLRVVGFAALVAVLFAVLLGRLWYLQVLTSDNYTLSAESVYTREQPIPAERGAILDRSGDVLANSAPGLDVTVVPDAISRDKVEELARILEADVPAVLDRYDAAVSSGSAFSPLLIKENAGEDDVTYVSERTEEFAGMSVTEAPVRNYPDGGLASHILGYTGVVSESQLGENRFGEVPGNAVVGQSGIELQYESVLSGEPGSKEYNVDSQGRVLDDRQRAIDSEDAVEQPSRTTEPAPGNDVALTIDRDLQRVAENELDAAIERAKEEGYAGTGGSIVALDPTNGQVLAMASRPDFDPGLFVGGISGGEEVERYQYLSSDEANAPFTNRSISGTYPAASTFKVFTGIAGLAYDAITPSTTVTDTGDCWRPKGVTTGCWQSWRQVKGYGDHGTQNYAEALMDSNDKFFYQVADWMWQKVGDENLLPDFYKKFGFGEQTGIDLVAEAEGRVPDSGWQREAGATPEDRFWSVGRWVNLSIGQGDLLVTPIQLARSYAALQNGGTLVTPHVGLEVREGNGKVLEKVSPAPGGRVELTARQRQTTIEGLRKVTGDGGTAERAFSGSPLEIVGKTGTGEMGERDPVAWFAGWAENRDNPLVVVAMVEAGGDGEPTTAPAVRHVLESYYGVEDVPADPFQTSTSPEISGGSPASPPAN